MDATLLSFTLEELTTKRKELSTALDSLLSGGRVVSAGHEGGQSAFQQTSPEKLRARIAEYTEAINAKESGRTSTGPRPVHLVL